MKLFKSMNKKESLNWKKAAILGFYTFLLLLTVNYIFYLRMDKGLISSRSIFWSGLVVAFGYDALLNIKDKIKPGYKAPGS
ncbi:hypothetical protein SporoS204_03250 [Sporosarcina ureae]|uniref:Uncharacterized protein n=2 Tax=Sporosarcina ureae TaxID=1571 RepID=A0ABM6JSX4_SPOUR|nr:hypothetical protein SporoS204_03250 [Sporosarcina ureae]